MLSSGLPGLRFFLKTAERREGGPASTPEQDLIPQLQPGVCDQVAPGILAGAEKEPGRETASAKHEFASHGLGQAGAFPRCARRDHVDRPGDTAGHRRDGRENAARVVWRQLPAEALCDVLEGNDEQGQASGAQVEQGFDEEQAIRPGEVEELLDGAQFNAIMPFCSNAARNASTSASHWADPTS